MAIFVSFMTGDHEHLKKLVKNQLAGHSNIKQSFKLPAQLLKKKTSRLLQNKKYVARRYLNLHKSFFSFQK